MDGSTKVLKLSNSFNLLFVIFLFSTSLLFAGKKELRLCIVKYDSCVDECKEQDGCMSEAEECVDVCKNKRQSCIKKLKATKQGKKI